MSLNKLPVEKSENHLPAESRLQLKGPCLNQPLGSGWQILTYTGFLLFGEKGRDYNQTVICGTRR